MNWYKRNKKKIDPQYGLFDNIEKPVAIITRFGNNTGIHFSFDGKMYTCPIYNPPLLKNLQTLISRKDFDGIKNRFIPNFGCYEE